MSLSQSPLGLVRNLCNELYIETGGDLSRLVPLHELGLRHPETSIVTLEVAISLALEKGWLIKEGGDHPVAVRLTESGARLG